MSTGPHCGQLETLSLLFLGNQGLKEEGWFELGLPSQSSTQRLEGHGTEDACEQTGAHGTEDACELTERRKKVAGQDLPLLCVPQVPPWSPECETNSPLETIVGHPGQSWEPG